MLKLLPLTVDLSIFPNVSVDFCFTCFVVKVLGTYRSKVLKLPAENFFFDDYFMILFVTLKSIISIVKTAFFST